LTRSTKNDPEETWSFPKREFNVFPALDLELLLPT